jgi:restriction system protein
MTVVQAKRWTSGNVSGKVIRELRGALHVDEHGVVITTANFTPEAVVEATAQGKAPVGMVDGPSLVQLLIENGLGVSTVSVPLRRLDPASLLAGDE